ncbi:MAG: hypothetical protein WC351_06165 [Candidatus Izemoplasmatales bacterium]|jgi:hypothetical protein
MEENKQLKPYVRPLIEIIEFTLDENIATSMNMGPSTLCGEEVW